MTRIVAFGPFLEFVNGATGATGEGEMASRTAARSPPPTRAGGQDDGSYTNSLKLCLLSALQNSEFSKMVHDQQVRPRVHCAGGQDDGSYTNSLK